MKKLMIVLGLCMILILGMGDFALASGIRDAGVVRAWSGALITAINRDTRVVEYHFMCDECGYEESRSRSRSYPSWGDGEITESSFTCPSCGTRQDVLVEFIRYEGFYNDSDEEISKELVYSNRYEKGLQNAFTEDFTDTDAKVVENMSVRVNGKTLELDQPPVLMNGKVLVPVGAISEALGVTVFWNPELQGITLYQNNYNYVVLIVGDYTAYSSKFNTNFVLDQPPIIVGDRVLVPVRFVGEAFGAEVSWIPGSAWGGSGGIVDIWQVMENGVK